MTEKEKQEQQEALDYVASLYYDTDGHKWEPQIDRANFFQQQTKPHGLDTVMFRARTTLKCNIHHIR